MVDGMVLTQDLEFEKCNIVLVTSSAWYSCVLRGS